MKIIFRGVKSPNLLELERFESDGHQSFESSPSLAGLAAGWLMLWWVPDRKPAGKGTFCFQFFFPLKVEQNV